MAAASNVLCVPGAFKAIFYFYVRTNCKKIAKQQEREKEKVVEKGREREVESELAQLSVDVIKGQFRNVGHNNTPGPGNLYLPAAAAAAGLSQRPS